MLPTKEVTEGKAVIAPPLLVAGNCSIANQLRAIKNRRLLQPWSRRNVSFRSLRFAGPSDRSNEIPSPDNHVTARVPVTRM